MTAVTREEFEEWIMRQPPEKEVDMKVPMWNKDKGDCGCLMVQYGKSHVQNPNFIECSFCGIWISDSTVPFFILDFDIVEFIEGYGFDTDSEFTFGEIQKKIK